MLNGVVQSFDIEGEVTGVDMIHGGLINNTWKVKTTCKNYLFQTVNQQVFKKPEAIAQNIRMLADYFQKEFPGYLFTQPVPAKGGSDLVIDHGFVYRVFPFVNNSHTIAVVQNADQAFEAAQQFGKFTAYLKDFPRQKLNITLPDFHNLELRYKQFLEALDEVNNSRMETAAGEIQQLKEHANLVDIYKALLQNPDFRLRVTHHDTKISNVLFDEGDKGICVIDLDTVMPGYFISDVGDMMRTYLSPASEEEQDLNKITVRGDIYHAIRRGYLGQMGSELTPAELAHFDYSGRFMIYMQALRFITDYLYDDIYYGEKYPGHNLVRGQNQLRLLEEYDKFIGAD